MARPTHQPTKETKERVKTLIGYGLTVEQVGSVIGIDAKTLKKHYEEEVLNGRAAALETVVGALFRNIRKGNVAAQIFYLKTQGRWREKDDEQRIEISLPRAVFKVGDDPTESE